MKQVYLLARIIDHLLAGSKTVSKFPAPLAIPAQSRIVVLRGGDDNEQVAINAMRAVAARTGVEVFGVSCAAEVEDSIARTARLIVSINDDTALCAQRLAALAQAPVLLPMLGHLDPSRRRDLRIVLQPHPVLILTRPDGSRLTAVRDIDVVGRMTYSTHAHHNKRANQITVLPSANTLTIGAIGSFYKRVWTEKTPVVCTLDTTSHAHIDGQRHQLTAGKYTITTRDRCLYHVVAGHGTHDAQTDN